MHGSRVPLWVDEEGRREVNRILDGALEAILRVREEAGERLAESGEEGLHMRATMLCIDTPPPKGPRAR
jgi:hypothetical protein